MVKPESLRNKRCVCRWEDMIGVDKDYKKIKGEIIFYPEEDVTSAVAWLIDWVSYDSGLKDTPTAITVKTRFIEAIGKAFPDIIED